MIDGNNLLHAARALGPTRPPGRERLLRLVEQWARDHHKEVVIVFDGPVPRGPFAGQMQSQVVEVVFSGARSADDCIVERVGSCSHPDRVRVITDDTAVLHEARRRRCPTLSTQVFLASLFPPPLRGGPTSESRPCGEKPERIAPGERDEWLASFDDGVDDEPFDGFDAMRS